MYKTLGYISASFGGIIILGMFPDVLGQLANAITGYYGHGFSDFVIDSSIVVFGIALFGFGVRWMKNTYGVVFLSIGGLSFLTTLMPVIIDFVEFSRLNNPYSLGQTIGHCLVLIFGISLFVIGIRSFNVKGKDENVIDDLE